MNDSRNALGRRASERALAARRLRVLGWIFGGAAWLACARTPPRADAVDAGLRASSASSASSATFLAGTPPGPPIVTVGDKIAFEAAHRTATDTPKVEAVYAALEKAGFKLSEMQQHVASVFGAQYCVGAKTENEMAFSVCEYGSPEEARSGREASLKALASVPNRAIYVNRKTTLTIRQRANATSASEAASKAAADSFGRL